MKHARWRFYNLDHRNNVRLYQFGNLQKVWQHTLKSNIQVSFVLLNFKLFFFVDFIQYFYLDQNKVYITTFWEAVDAVGTLASPDSLLEAQVLIINRGTCVIKQWNWIAYIRTKYTFRLLDSWDFFKNYRTVANFFNH